MSPFVGDCADENGITTVAWQIYRYATLLHESSNLDTLSYLQGLANHVDMVFQDDRLFKSPNIGAQYRDPVYLRHIELAGIRWRCGSALALYVEDRGLHATYDQDLQFIGAAANLYDASLYYQEGNTAAAMASMAAAVLMTMGADLTFRVEAIQLDAQENLYEAKLRYESARREAETYKSEAETFKTIAEPFISKENAGRKRDMGLSLLLDLLIAEYPTKSAQYVWNTLDTFLKKNEGRVNDSCGASYMIKKTSRENRSGVTVDCIQSYLIDSFDAQETPESEGLVMTSFSNAFNKAKKKQNS
jgi:hypothetical protein